MSDNDKQTEPEIKTWNHRRSGKMVGEMVTRDPNSEWVDIRLAKTCRRGDQGEIVTVRRVLLTEVSS